MLLPLVFLVVEAQQSGWGEVERLLLRHTVAVLLWNTVRLVLACTVLCAVDRRGGRLVRRAHRRCPGGVCGRCCSCCRSGIPDFVVGFGWVSLDHGLHGYAAAVLIMTLSLYPLVYLPVAGALARRRPGSLEEVARSLGHGAVADLLAGDAAPDLAGGARRLPARDARPAGRVRSV